MVVCCSAPLVPVTVMLYVLPLLPGNAKPPPHPERAVSAPSEAKIKMHKVIQRRRSLRVAKSNPKSGSMVAAIGHPEPLPPTDAVVVGAAV